MKLDATGCARVTTAGVGLFVVVMYVAFVFIQPELNPLQRFGSEYVVGTAGWLMKIAFFCLAAALIALVLAMALGLDPETRSPTGMILFTVGALGILFAGIFDTDLQVRTATGWGEASAVSKEHVAHFVSGVIAFMSLLPAMAVVSHRWWRAGVLRNGYIWLVYLSWLAPVGFIAFNVWFIPAGLAGLGQRLFLGLVFAWLLLASRAFLKGAFIVTHEAHHGGGNGPQLKSSVGA